MKEYVNCPFYDKDKKLYKLSVLHRINDKF